MIKKVLALFLILTGVFAFSAVGQSSAQATMRVSVKVVKGISVEMKTPEKIRLASNTDIDLGSLLLAGFNSDNSIVTVKKDLLLAGSKGNKAKLDVSSRIEDSKSLTFRLAFSGFSTDDMKADNYQGQLHATVEYL